MSGPSWAILIPTLGQRSAEFRRLLKVLLPQLDPYAGRVRVVGAYNNGERALSHVRHDLVQAAVQAGYGYLSFVDDDDLVPEFFVAEVLAALDLRPDFVGWQVQVYNRGQPKQVSYHSLQYGGWVNDGDKLYRDITHINPMRTDLAAQADFRVAAAGQPEDRLWVEQLRGRLRTEVVIDKVMYHYLYSPATSSWRYPKRIRRHGHTRAEVAHPYFSWLEDARA